MLKKTLQYVLLISIAVTSLCTAQDVITTVDVNTQIMSNPSLLLGITFDCRTSLLANANTPAGYYDTNAVVIPALDAVFHDFPMSTLRYPANGILQRFQWKNSIGPVASRPAQNLFGGSTPNQVIRFGFDEFMAMTASRGVNPADVQIMVPIYDSASSGLTSAQQMGAIPNVIQSNADWVEYANAPNDSSNPGGGIDWAAVRAANGHPQPYGIEIWNLGNEPWSPSEDSFTVSGCTAYLNRITPIIDSMLAIDPTIKLTLATVGNANSNWNKTIKNSSLVAQGKIYGISPHYFPSEPWIGVANVEAVLPVLADTAQQYGLKVFVGDYAPNIALAASSASQDSSMQWGGANLCADLLLLMSQTTNIERANFWTYGLPAASYHAVRRNSDGTYTSMPAAELYKTFSPLFLEYSVLTTTASPAGSDGNPYSCRSSAFVSDDSSKLNVITVNRDRNDVHTIQVNGVSEYILVKSHILTATGLDADVFSDSIVSVDSLGNYALPPMSILILEYLNEIPPVTFTINASAANHGTIFPAGTGTINSGSDTLFTFNPDPGFHVSGIFIDGIYTDPLLSYMFTNVTEDHSIRVVFASNSVGSISPADTNANLITQYVLRELDSLRSRTSNRIISGQMMDHRHAGIYSPTTEFDTSITSIHDQTGKWVGLIGTDYFRSFTWPQGGISRMNETNLPLMDYFHQGGLVAVMSHFKNPWTGGNGNDLTGSSNLLDIITPSHPANIAFLDELDSLATGFSQLQDSGITVLYRPFQEMNGNWFWWGSKSNTLPVASDFVALWQYVFNYLTVTKNLHNILWVYSPSARASGVGNPAFKTELFYYPGDEYVDIFGLDVYSDTIDIPNYDSILMQGKPLAIAEFGPEKAGVTNNPFSYDYTTLINQIKNKYPDFVYWMSWNHFATNGGATNIYYSMSTQSNTDLLLADNWVITREELSHQAPSIVTLDVDDGWNLVSLPMKSSDSSKSSLFPSATSEAYAYSGGYTPYNLLTHGKGYWLKFNGGQTIQVQGTTVQEDTFQVVTGWNIIGSISENVLTSNIVSSPAGITTTQFFGFTGGYGSSDTIIPGKGYWVKVNQDGLLILSSNGSLSSTAKIRVVPTNELPPTPPGKNADINDATIPNKFAISQNYPNPFNPVTTLKYQLPVASNVHVQIYSVLGKEVAALVDEIQNAGYKSIRWDASALPSGVYFYHLTATPLDGSARQFTSVRKLLLMK